MLAALPEKFRHIVIEGPIGAGKTSLARRLAERTDFIRMHKTGRGRFQLQVSRTLTTQLVES